MSTCSLRNRDVAGMCHCVAMETQTLCRMPVNRCGGRVTGFHSSMMFTFSSSSLSWSSQKLMESFHLALADSWTPALHVTGGTPAIFVQPGSSEALRSSPVLTHLHVQVPAVKCLISSVRKTLAHVLYARSNLAFFSEFSFKSRVRLFDLHVICFKKQNSVLQSFLCSAQGSLNYRLMTMLAWAASSIS